MPWWHLQNSIFYTFFLKPWSESFFKSFKHVLWNNSYLSTLVHSLNLLIVFLNFRNKFSPINLRHFSPPLCVWFWFLLLERSICSMRTDSLVYTVWNLLIYIQKDKKTLLYPNIYRNGSTFLHFCTKFIKEQRHCWKNTLKSWPKLTPK